MHRIVCTTTAVATKGTVYHGIYYTTLRTPYVHVHHIPTVMPPPPLLHELLSPKTTAITQSAQRMALYARYRQLALVNRIAPTTTYYTTYCTVTANTIAYGSVVLYFLLILFCFVDLERSETQSTPSPRGTAAYFLRTPTRPKNTLSNHPSIYASSAISVSSSLFLSARTELINPLTFTSHLE